ncbi:MAG: leucyl aminopeptidase [Gammaproteobacteria bacterium]|nr:leucyl aminopeptidase [Gammaproteobacteria bacterium]
MEYLATTSAASGRSADCLVVGVYERGKTGTAAAEIDKASSGQIRALIKSGDITGELGSCLVLRDVKNVKAQRVVVVGLGKSGNFGVDQFRQATAAAANAVKSSKSKDFYSYLTLEDVDDVSVYYLARHTVETVGDCLYVFDEMKSGKRKGSSSIRKIGLAIKKRGHNDKAMLGARHADGIVTGASLAKDLGNLPPNVCNPAYLAKTAQGMARRHKKLTTRVLNEAEMKKLGMHSLLSVTRGATAPAKLIVMQYRGGGKQKPVVLVGKGITFDTGGISLKPGPAMDEMKYDMCGAASVIGTMATIATLDVPVNLTVVVPAAENMPGGDASRPGDIVKSMSGQTIEILNTDAEGRLVLCDALTYSRKFKPDAIIDVATLTGACVIALGHHRCAVFSNDEALSQEILDAGKSAADKGWPMPMGEEYALQLRSNFADFANIGGRDGGAITAACFLGKFTDGLSWAHLDIAGVAWRTGAKKGGTGRPVPMLSEFVLKRAGALP